MSHTGLKCMRCRYDLRATAIDGRCPECGKPVTESIEVQVATLSSITPLREMVTPLIFVQCLGSLANIVLWTIAGASGRDDILVWFLALWFVASITWLGLTIAMSFLRGSRQATPSAAAMCAVSVVAMLVNLGLGGAGF